jgi:hypothetical protein
MAEKMRDDVRVMEKDASRSELRELLRRERLRSSHLRNDLITLTIERDYLLRIVNMLKLKLAAVDTRFVSKRTYSNLGKMLRRRMTGHRIKEIGGMIRLQERKKR